MAPRENKNNAYAKFGETSKTYYGIFRTGLLELGGTFSACYTWQVTEGLLWQVRN